MNSIWHQNIEKKSFPMLDKDISCDTLIIGGGLAGVLTAYFLSKKKVDYILLEADEIGSGQSGKTTGKITSQHGLIYADLIKKYGHKKALEYATVNQQAIKDFKAISEEEKIECDFKVLPAYLYTERPDEVALLKKEEAAALELNIPASFTDETKLPFPVEGALRFDSQAEFHPLKFIYSLAEKLNIYEYSKVIRLEGNNAVTTRGNVSAKNIVFACHFPFVNFPGCYFLKMHQEKSYLIALKNAENIEGMYLELGKTGKTFRNHLSCLLIGGGDHRTGEKEKGNEYDKLKEFAEKYFPDSSVAFEWSAEDCMPIDYLPYIGRFSKNRPDWYVMTGFQKWGMTMSMVGAKMVSDLVRKQKSPLENLFSPSRRLRLSSVKNIVPSGIATAKSFGKRVFCYPAYTLSDLKAEEGKIVEFEGEKLGAYKDAQGNVFLVSAICPHLGCQLEWNISDKSWDCPCHGSRFDYKGNVIDSPAEIGLDRFD